ncbi:MAG: ATP-dependent Clp protease proteolytic subunit [Oscillospiraceae bacterium]|nr:ATP-dependent Clp protease proteolytic subunit [Oscillospiraceae bacterium]
MKNVNIIYESNRGYQSLDITDTLYKERVIFLDDEINPTTALETIKQLVALDRESNDEIKLFINSPGGCVTSGLAICDTIEIIKSPVTTVCIGLAASMGAVIFLHGKNRQMMKHSKIMLHDPSFGGGNLRGKKPHEIETELNELREVQETLVNIISEKTGKPKEEVYEITKKDTYFDFEKARYFGIATNILTKF